MKKNSANCSTYDAVVALIIVKHVVWSGVFTVMDVFEKLQLDHLPIDVQKVQTILDSLCERQVLGFKHAREGSRVGYRTSLGPNAGRGQTVASLQSLLNGHKSVQLAASSTRPRN